MTRRSIPQNQSRANDGYWGDGQDDIRRARLAVRSSERQTSRDRMDVLTVCLIIAASAAVGVILAMVLA